MRSRIFLGETTHCRVRPRRHAFRYRMFWLALDVDELADLDRRVRGFGHNRWALAAVHDGDHGRDDGAPTGGSLRVKVEAALRRAGVETPIERIDMHTIPRVAGYAFAPVTFYLCAAAGGAVAALVAEVRNTFGEMHDYVAVPADGAAAGEQVFHVPKQFYVSPFLAGDGAYVVRLTGSDDRFDLRIDLRQDGETVFSASMAGRGRPLTGGHLLGALGRLPLFAATIMARIHWQALLLYVGKRLPVFARPVSPHAHTIVAARPGAWHRLRSAFVRRARREPVARASQPRLLSERES